MEQVHFLFKRSERNRVFIEYDWLGYCPHSKSREFPNTQAPPSLLQVLFHPMFLKESSCVHFVPESPGFELKIFLYLLVGLSAIGFKFVTEISEMETLNSPQDVFLYIISGVRLTFLGSYPALGSIAYFLGTLLVAHRNQTHSS
jgi:hypothetical protein